MLKIGEFAKLFNVSLKTIRFYEEKNLLKPAYIDEFSGYRYYDDYNIETMRKILYLKDLGFSLDEIKNYNDEIVQYKINEYKKAIEKLTTNISILEEKLLTNNRDYKTSTAKEKYIESVTNILKKKGGTKMFEENNNIYGILSKEEGLVLGKGIYLPSDKRGNTNCLLVAGSGAGKSASYVIPNIYRTLGSYVVTDPLGEIYEKTHEYMKNHGYIVKTINYANSQDNYNYDPINHINSDRDIEVLADILIGDNNDPFWDDSAKILVKAIIYYILEKAEKKNLLTLFYLLSEGKEALFSKFDELEKDSKGDKYARLIKTFPEKTYASVASTALVRVSFIINKYSSDIVFDEKINFSQLYDQKTIFYISFNESNKDDQKLANIFVAQVLSQLEKREDVNENIYFLLDAVGMLGKIQDLGTHILTSRGRKLSISLISNSFSNLEKIYGDEIYTMLNTIDTQMLLGTNIQSDIDYFSQILGVDENEIRTLDRDKLLIFEKGLKAILAEKDYFFNHDEWK